MEKSLVATRESILNKLQHVFRGKAIEAHVFGSIARGDADAYSDLDIWFTFNDNEYEEIYKNRFEYYKLAGEVIHVCEPPQNAPVNGVHSALLVREIPGCTSMIDVYLCPQSTSYITEEAKKLFGIDLRLGTIGFSLQKVQVDENYRINFFICFIFNTIKKLARNEEFPLDAVLREYGLLRKNYDISVGMLTIREQNFSALEEIIKNIKKLANEKQKITLDSIHDFARKVFT